MISIRRPFSALACASLLLLAAGCSSQAWQLAPAPATEVPAIAAPRFVVIADTQYSVPGTDYDVRATLGPILGTFGPTVTTALAKSFYRHAAANHVLPDVFDSVLRVERARGAAFGLFLGDMLEFACEQEADTMFGVLKANRELPVVIALGNHDATFHGSFDTDGVGLDGSGEIDRFALAKWKQVCKPLGGPMTKPEFVERVVDYYAEAWGLDIKHEHGFQGQPLPIDQTLEGETSRLMEVGGKRLGRWTLRYSVLRAGSDLPTGHRRSHLWQRFSWEPMHATTQPITLTVLDSTDYAKRAIGCGEVYAKLGQVGVKGALSPGQVAWLEDLGAPTTGDHLVLSHYLPFAEVDGESDCDLCAGAGCGFERRILPAWGKKTRFLYGHVHRPFRPEVVTKAVEGEDEPVSYKLFRIPSLIDNHRYVVLDGQRLVEQEIVGSAFIESQRPFAGHRFRFSDLLRASPETVAIETCRQRHAEFVELERNVACYRNDRHLPPSGAQACVPLGQAIAARKAEADAICVATETWKRQRAAEWAAIAAGDTSPPGACARFDQEHWRCILRGLGARTLASLEPAQRVEFARAQLAGTTPTPE